jgi:hypothetical protein
MTDIQRVKHFLNEYAVKFGVPLPGRLPNHRNLKVTLLPSDKTKADIHQIYLEAAKSLNYRVICLSEFKQLWLEQCPQIYFSEFMKMNETLFIHLYNVCIECY